MKDFSTLLIANRGEIACRIMRTARSMGLRTVAVYSEADAEAPHVRLADWAVLIGPAPAAESYLQMDAIFEAARIGGAEAIHPGYGFLSENAAFARAAEEAGLVFVGPPPGAIEIMGDKARAKRAMIEAGVPVAPGYQGEDQSEATLLAEGEAIGFPLMVKAAAGGGGRGMRLVHKAKDLPAALKLARAEAENAFGSGDLILEKAIVRPRHVEIQIIADAHGNVLHLGERDCSVQRRHQKVVEEAPCPVMTPELRAAMGAAAVEAARAVDYRSAGTVEFLLDEAGAFHFLEMNTRLQVEHPVTELVTGRDLVALQLEIAQGKPLGFAQEDVRFDGWAIEARLCAEDPTQGFLPSTGPVRLFAQPEGVRVDAGVETGGEVSAFYDSMVAKIIAHGPTRETARRRLVAALEATALIGPATNRDFLIDVMGQDAFVTGQATTALIAECYGGENWSRPALGAEDLALAGLARYALAQRRSYEEAGAVSPELLDWASTGELVSVFAFERGEETVPVEVRTRASGLYEIAALGQNFEGAVEALEGDHAVFVLNGRRLNAIVHALGADSFALAAGPLLHVWRDVSAGAAGEAEGGGGRVAAPMHGKLIEIFVVEGAVVSKGDKLAVLEAMKMQHEIVAGVDGAVSVIAARPGMQIAAGELILEIEAPDAPG